MHGKNEIPKFTTRQLLCLLREKEELYFAYNICNGTRLFEIHEFILNI